MKQTVCRVSECDRRAIALDLCRAHYQRNRTHGDPLAHIPVRDLSPLESTKGEGFRVCRRCKADKPIEEFTPRGDRPPTYCRPCTSEVCNDWNKANPDTTYGAHLKRTYGITLDEYERMAEEQGWACKICLEVPEKRLNVHHNHETGEVIGLACWNCNSGLGKFKDNPELLRRAALFHEGLL